LLVGQDPRRVEHLWQTMHRQYFWRSGIVNCSAMSAIDQALWDTQGKGSLASRSVELLGRPGSRYLAPSTITWAAASLEGMYKTIEPAHIRRSLAGKRLAKGFTAVKAMPIPVAEPHRDAKVLKDAARCVEAMRKAAGDGVDIMLDLHARTTPAAAFSSAAPR